MKKTEKQKYAKELKKEYKDYEEYTDKKGKDRIRFNLGEIQVPELVKSNVMKVIPKDGKNYLIFNIDLGMNDKVKKQRKEERIRESQIREKRKEDLRTRIKLNKEQIRKLVTQNKSEGIANIIKENKQMFEDLEKLKTR